MTGNDRKRRQETEIRNNESKEGRCGTNNEIQKQRQTEKSREGKETKIKL
jgi:hypothetical protein